MHATFARGLASVFLVSLGALLASSGAGCGSDTAVVEGDGGLDGASDDGGLGACVQVGAACGTSADCCTVNCDATSKTCAAPVGGNGICKTAGMTCASATECCGGTCTGGTCGAKLCTSDGKPCASDGECCGGICGTGDAGAKTCIPLNPTCKTSGNLCATNGDCCSKLCANGVCNAHPSFCIQMGDACASDAECCGGLCTKSAGAPLGVCGLAVAQGTPQCTPAGQLCGSATTGDGGAGDVPICGGECCSRSCRPYAPTGALICEPPSGCHPTGEICQTDNDCCGAPGMPGSTNSNGGGQTTDVHCSKAPGATIGRCDNGKACSPAGAICRLATNSCNATDRCCAGTVQTHPLNCKQDSLGIPRCTAASDYDCTVSGPPPAGTACASSADCCNNPCVPNPAGTPPFVCGATPCVNAGGACTTTSDCCTGSPCVVPPGSTKGTCGPSGGTSGGTDGGSTGTSDAGGPGSTPCGQYGQVCSGAGDCCSGLQCLNGRCGVIIK